jgi:hypothetical protein
MKARLAFSRFGPNDPGIVVNFTPRGKSDATIMRGFIRLNGKTISGHVYLGGYPLPVFFYEPKGINADVVRKVLKDAREGVAA